ncbi:MAG TPA: hypothetical protein VFZ26_18565 [Gemmatimonadales bacterium]
MAGHLALRARLGFSSPLEPRTRLLVARLAAEASGCRWCIERSRHDWRAAGLPSILPGQLGRAESSLILNEREREACRFARAVLRAGRDPLSPDVFTRARRCFSEFELADLAGCLADHHCLDDSLP